METKDLLKIIFSGLVTILIIPALNVFKVENGIVLKKIEYLNGQYSQSIYVTKDYSKPVIIEVSTVNDNLFFNYQDSKTLELLKKDGPSHFELQILQDADQLEDTLFHSMIVQLNDFPKGEYELHYRVVDYQGKNINKLRDKDINTIVKSNPGLHKEEELINNVDYRWYHFYYFNYYLTLFLIFISTVIFLFIVSKGKAKKVVYHVIIEKNEKAK